MTSHIPARPRGSSPVVGSSRNSTGGSATRAPAQVEPPAHAARPALDLAVGGVGEVELLQQLVGPGPAGRGAEVVEPAHHVEVLEAGEVLVDGGVLARDTDPAAQLASVADDVEPGHLGVAPGRP